MTTSHLELRHSRIQALPLRAFPKGKEFPKGSISCTGAAMSWTTVGRARGQRPGLSFSRATQVRAPREGPMSHCPQTWCFLSPALLSPPGPRISRSFTYRRLAKTHFELMVFHSLWTSVISNSILYVTGMSLPPPAPLLFCSLDL